MHSEVSELKPWKSEDVELLAAIRMGVSKVCSRPFAEPTFLSSALSPVRYAALGVSVPVLVSNFCV